MGWWKVQGTETVLGDVPLDILGDAVAEIIKEYQSALKRRPSKEEWESLLTDALLAGVTTERPEARALEEGVVRKVLIELER
jgi:hypothetical protein